MRGLLAPVGDAVGKMVIGSGEECEVIVRGVEDFERDFVRCTKSLSKPSTPQTTTCKSMMEKLFLLEVPSLTSREYCPGVGHVWFRGGTLFSEGEIIHW